MQGKIEKARSINGVYYILQGKPSIQTIQDTHLFGLEHYFGLLKTMKKQQFLDVVDGLVQADYLQKEAQDNHFIVTKQGLALLEQKNALQHHHFNGMLYSQTADLFFMRLQLLIQAWTNAKQHHFTYIPIVEDREVAKWVRGFYRKSKDRIADGLFTLYDELSHLLATLPTREVNLWIDQLSGYQVIGKTMDQLAIKYNLTTFDVQLSTVHVLHFILRKLEKGQAHCPLLTAIQKGLGTSRKITGSAEQTYTLLNKGFSPEHIAQSRSLKLGTIYDHLVEIALFDAHFPLDDYVPPMVQKQIYEALQYAPTWRLKEIKEQVADDISYFQIRLVLAKIKDLSFGGEEIESIR
jgi:uncharacterized protein YpbB